MQKKKKKKKPFPLECQKFIFGLFLHYPSVIQATPTPTKPLSMSRDTSETHHLQTTLLCPPIRILTPATYPNDHTLPPTLDLPSPQETLMGSHLRPTTMAADTHPTLGTLLPSPMPLPGMNWSG